MDKLLEKFMALGIGEKIIIIAGAVLLIDGFLPWYSASAEFAGVKVSASASGWESPGAFWSMLAILIGLAMAAVVVLKGLTEVAIPDNVGGQSWPRILLGGGVAALVLVVIKFLSESSNLGFGFYLGIIAAAALAAGGFLMFREESAAGPSGPPPGPPSGPPSGPPPGPA
ncbi:MAG: hypothetical protein Q7R32_11875 [Dehalococcoidia bacterium]|nr:hypothetical protein [Dehalococcoidia bacterium]